MNDFEDLCEDCKNELLSVADCSGGEKGAYNEGDVEKQLRICRKERHLLGFKTSYGEVHTRG